LEEEAIDGWVRAWEEKMRKKFRNGFEMIVEREKDFRILKMGMISLLIWEVIGRVMGFL